MRILIVCLYLISIAAANIITASLQPLVLGVFIVPAGTFIIGATFIFRDLVQNAIGRRKTYLTIAMAMIISAVVSSLLGDTLWIVLASTITFVFSETTDTEIYTRLRMPMAWKVFYSGLVSGVLDSVVFVIIGLSPWGAGFLPWSAVIMAIVGQIVVKTVLQMFGAFVVLIVSNQRGKYNTNE